MGQLAVAEAVERVEDQANADPDQQHGAGAHFDACDRDGVGFHAEDQVGAGSNAEQGNEGHAGAAEGTGEVRLFVAQVENAEADHAEGGQCAHAYQMAEDRDRREAGSGGDHQAHDHGVDVGGLEFGVHLAEDGGEKAVAGHDVEDTGLTVHGDHHDRGETSDRAELHDKGEPWHADGVDADGDGIGHVEVFIGDKAREDAGDDDVEDGADDQ